MPFYTITPCLQMRWNVIYAVGPSHVDMTLAPIPPARTSYRHSQASTPLFYPAVPGTVLYYLVHLVEMTDEERHTFPSS